ncbi:hypothetical protein HS088_TW14G00254 [Tripterygium wilfordii]|uniref:WEB family protein n=1 Tax=Tripterygium wilfordii TaxID=458696 RepID=A0A7J7CQ74_TRIWF|nr:hypothetical protein HS088_TW14G00254 [Tripterygium wilfordii]
MKERHGKGVPEESPGDAVKAKMVELILIKEKLKTARDSATQSWLDSKPLIDELEKLQSGLESSKNQSSKSTIVISQLQLQVETISKEIRSKMEEELKASHMINELGQPLDQTQDELETLQLEADEEHRARLKLKQVVRMRRQTLRALQLRLRAILTETEAFKASAAEASRHINNSKMKDGTIKLTHEEYYDLIKRAKEEELLAEGRISASMEQKLAAEASLNLALKRSIQLHSNNRPRRRRKKKGNITEDGDAVKDRKEQDWSGVRERTEDNNGGIVLSKPQANIIAERAQGNPQQKIRKSKTNNKRMSVKKRKASILRQIRSFFARLFR